MVAIPALNEEGSIGGVVAEVRAHQPTADVVVVDDGSTDRTALIARAAGARVLRLPFNLGVGGAMRAVYRLAEREGYDAVVQIDADGQHDPARIADLLAALPTSDIVVGARFAGRGTYRVRGPRWWAMRVLAGVLSRVTGTRLTDATSGNRLVNRRAIVLFAETYPEEYLGDTVESLVLAARAGLRVTQVPVEMRPRLVGTASQNAVRSAVYLGRAMVALGLALVRRRPRIPQDVS